MPPADYTTNAGLRPIRSSEGSIAISAAGDCEPPAALCSQPKRASSFAMRGASMIFAPHPFWRSQLFPSQMSVQTLFTSTRGSSDAVNSAARRNFVLSPSVGAVLRFVQQCEPRIADSPTDRSKASPTSKPVSASVEQHDKARWTSPWSVLLCSACTDPLINLVAQHEGMRTRAQATKTLSSFPSNGRLDLATFVTSASQTSDHCSPERKEIMLTRRNESTRKIMAESISRVDKILSPCAEETQSNEEVYARYIDLDKNKGCVWKSPRTNKFTLLKCAQVDFSAVLIQNNVRVYLAKKRRYMLLSLKRFIDDATCATDYIQFRVREILRRNELFKESLVNILMRTRARAASKIQVSWRNSKLRDKKIVEDFAYAISLARQISATRIQAAFRGYLTRKVFDEETQNCVVYWEHDTAGSIVEIIGDFTTPPWTRRILLDYCQIRKKYCTTLPVRPGQRTEFKFLVKGMTVCSGSFDRVPDSRDPSKLSNVVVAQYPNPRLNHVYICRNISRAMRGAAVSAGFEGPAFVPSNHHPMLPHLGSPIVTSPTKNHHHLAMLDAKQDLNSTPQYRYHLTMNNPCPPTLGPIPTPSSESCSWDVFHSPISNGFETPFESPMSEMFPYQNMKQSGCANLRYDNYDGYGQHSASSVPKNKIHNPLHLSANSPSSPWYLDLEEVEKSGRKTPRTATAKPTEIRRQTKSRVLQNLMKSPVADRESADSSSLASPSDATHPRTLGSETWAPGTGSGWNGSGLRMGSSLELLTGTARYDREDSTTNENRMRSLTPPLGRSGSLVVGERHQPYHRQTPSAAATRNSSKLNLSGHAPLPEIAAPSNPVSDQLDCLVSYEDKRMKTKARETADRLPTVNDCTGGAFLDVTARELANESTSSTRDEQKHRRIKDPSKVNSEEQISQIHGASHKDEENNNPDNQNSTALLNDSDVDIHSNKGYGRETQFGNKTSSEMDSAEGMSYAQQDGYTNCPTSEDVKKGHRVQSQRESVTRVYRRQGWCDPPSSISQELSLGTTQELYSDSLEIAHMDRSSNQRSSPALLRRKSSDSVHETRSHASPTSCPGSTWDSFSLADKETAGKETISEPMLRHYQKKHGSQQGRSQINGLLHVGSKHKASSGLPHWSERVIPTRYPEPNVSRISAVGSTSVTPVSERDSMSKWNCFERNATGNEGIQSRPL